MWVGPNVGLGGGVPPPPKEPWHPTPYLLKKKYFPNKLGETLQRAILFFDLQNDMKMQPGGTSRRERGPPTPAVSKKYTLDLPVGSGNKKSTVSIARNGFRFF